MKKVKNTVTLKKVVDKVVMPAGKNNLPCGTSIKFSRGKRSLLLTCGPEYSQNGTSNVVLSVPDLCCRDPTVDSNDTSHRSLSGMSLLASASSCGQQGFPVSGMCPYSSGTVVW